MVAELSDYWTSSLKKYANIVSYLLTEALFK